MSSHHKALVGAASIEGFFKTHNLAPIAWIEHNDGDVPVYPAQLRRPTVPFLCIKQAACSMEDIP